MAWSKLDSSIMHSTIWQEPSDIRIVWITMLAMSDRRGYVGASLPGLAHAARVPLESAAAAIDRFSSPDPDSRNPDHEGRRIEKTEGGWLVLNYEAYRLGKREIAAEKKRLQRQRGKEAQAEPAPPPTPANQAKQLEAARLSVPCLQCGQPWRLIHGQSGDFYGHGKNGSGTGCRATCPVANYETELAAKVVKLCSRCGERQVLGDGFEGGALYCGPCQFEVTNGR